MAWDKTVPTTTTVVSSSCLQFQNNWQAITAVCSAQHQDITLGSISHSAGLVEALYVGTTAEIAALTPAACSCAWNTTLKDIFLFTAVASSNGGGFVPSTTKMVFYADTAPAGWTIVNTLDDKLAFITKGSAAGGETGAGAHSTGTWTHTTHTHTAEAHDHGGVTGASSSDTDWLMYNDIAINYYQHTHTISTQAEMTSDINAVVTAWRPAAYCYIVASKD